MFTTLFVTVSAQLPLAVVGGVGLWLSISRRRRHHRVSSWASAGFGFLLIFVILQVWNGIAAFPMDATEAPEAAAAEFVRISLVRYAAYLLQVVGIACLARAVFVERNNAVRKAGGE